MSAGDVPGVEIAEQRAMLESGEGVSRRILKNAVHETERNAHLTREVQQVTMDNDASKSEKPVSHARRDRLLEIEKEVQKRWPEAKIFEIDAPSETTQEGEKFSGNFPYP